MSHPQAKSVGYKNMYINTYMHTLFLIFCTQYHKNTQNKKPTNSQFANFANSIERNKQVFHMSENLLKNK